MTNNSVSNSVTVSLEKLAAAASGLNAASNELGKLIATADEALKTLNLGVRTWLLIGEYGDQTSIERHYIGYGRVQSKWGLALSIAEEDSNSGLISNDEAWLFNDAPRHLRVEAIDKLPALIEKLSEVAVKTTNEIREKTEHARKVVVAISDLAAGTGAAKRTRK